MSGQAILTVGSKQWTVSLATAPQELVQGLGGLLSIPPGTGMLFDMGQEQMITVTTVSMLFPLDILFLDSSFIVNGIALNVAPGYIVTTEASAPARFFLEVNAGEAGGVQKGQQASLNAVSSGTPSAADGLSQAISLIASMFALSLVVSMVKSFVQGVLPMPRRAAGPSLMMAKTSSRLIELEASKLPQATVNEDLLDKLQSLLDENKKTDSLRKLESMLNKLTPEQRRSIDGLHDVERAIKEYKGIERSGLTPEDYASEKESAWGDIEDAVNNLSVEEETGDAMTIQNNKITPQEFFADSAGHCCNSVDGTGLRPQLEQAFINAIARVKNLPYLANRRCLEAKEPTKRSLTCNRSHGNSNSTSL